MAEDLRPKFFVTRQNGAMVPLIAADELPPDLNLVDVPRELTPYDLRDMKPLGNHNSQHQHYNLERWRGREATNSPTVSRSTSHDPNNPSSQLQRPKNADTHLERSGLDEAVTSLGLVQQSHAAHSPSQISESAPKLPQRNDSGASAPLTPLLPSVSLGSTEQAELAELADPRSVAPILSPGMPSDVGPELLSSRIDNLPIMPGRKKEYCSFWIRHGECDFTQQGCLYRHEMPMDPITLARLGLRDIPWWYQERYGVSSILPTTSFATKPRLLEEPWRRQVPSLLTRPPNAIEASAPSYQKERKELELPARPAETSKRSTQKKPRFSGLEQSIHALTVTGVPQIEYTPLPNASTPRRVAGSPSNRSPALIPDSRKLEWELPKPSNATKPLQKRTNSSPLPNYPALLPQPGPSRSPISDTSSDDSNPATKQSDTVIKPAATPAARRSRHRSRGKRRLKSFAMLPAAAVTTGPLLMVKPGHPTAADQATSPPINAKQKEVTTTTTKQASAKATRQSSMKPQQQPVKKEKEEVNLMDA